MVDTIRASRFPLVAVLVATVFPITRTVDCFAQEGQWTKVADMPTARIGFGTAVLDGKIYVIGGSAGSDGQDNLDVVEVYDPQTDSWEQKSDVPVARALLQACAVNGRIYVLGGGGLWFWGSARNRTYVFDPENNLWDRVADMPTARTAFSAVVVENKIYAISGAEKPLSEAAFPNVDEYDPATDTWTRKADIPTPRWSHAAVGMHGMIYAIGGNVPDPTYTGLTSVEVYDPSTDAWTTGTDMNVGRRYHAAATDGFRIYVVAGASGASTGFRSVEVYNPDSDVWSPGPELPHGFLANHSAVVVDGFLYVIGGSTEPPPFNIVPSVYKLALETVTGTESERVNADAIPSESRLRGNFPNPFARSTSIRYDIAEPTHVKLSLIDILGRTVVDLLDEPVVAGRHAVMWESGEAVSGLYFVRLHAGNFTDTRSMFLVR